MRKAIASSRGVTLMDTLVSIALLCLVFVGIYGVFLLSIDVVVNNKARIGALALANEEMEYIRSLPYTSVGTTGGIPSGTIPQNQTVNINGVPYNRNVFIEYQDLPQDGTGAADTNHIITDAKQAEIAVSWNSKNGTRTISLVTLITPPAVETSVPGGTLSITVRNAANLALQSASVRVVNSSTTPAIDLTTSTDNLGQMVLLGVPAASGYRITVTDDNKSTAQTYSVSASLTNPNPGHLTVSLNQTTAATFAIDTLSSYAIRTWQEISNGLWSDTFNDSSAISTSTNIAVLGGHVERGSPSADGTVTSNSLSPTYLYAWTSASWIQATSSGNVVRYSLYSNGSIVPDSVLAGNGAGFTVSPVNLSAVSTTTYPSLALRGTLSGGSATSSPQILSWQIDYQYGPQPLPNISYALRGAKTIGTTGASVTVYKYDATGSSGASSAVTLPNMEWDTYTLSVPSSSGYDIATSCSPQPTALSPGVDLTTDLYLRAHTTNSLLVDVRAGDGTFIPNATITLARGAFNSSTSSNFCGQTFFSGLSSGTQSGGNAYTLTVTKSGYQNFSATNVDVSGSSRRSVVLVP